MAKKGKDSHLLVIRLSAMGDVAMLVPVFTALFKAYPNLRISLLTKIQFAPIFKDFENITVITADVKGKHKGLFGLFRLFKTLKSLRIDAVADTHNVLRSNILKVLFKINAIPVVQINKGRQEKKALTRTRDKVFKPLKTAHERYADLFGQLGYTINLEQGEPLKKLIIPKEVQGGIGDVAKKRIGIAPFAAHQGKMYPLDLMEKVIGELVAQGDYTILLFGGGKQEEKLLDGIAKKIGPQVINVAGKYSFNEELILLSNLNVMVAMDSGNGHLAANYGVPVITLWGVTHPYAGFAPFGQKESYRILVDRSKYPMIPTSIYGNTFPKGYEDAMRTIVPKTVANKVNELLTGAS